MTTWKRSTLRLGADELVVLRAGTGEPLLVLHDELGHTGWHGWHEALAAERELILPLQPGYGDTPPIEWITSYPELGAFYAWALRDLGLGPVDAVGFSAGGYVGAEMAVANPGRFRSLALVAPLGVRPSSGEIFDFLAVTVRSHLEALASKQDGEYATVFGTDLSVEQYERIEDARAETARLGWEPFMFDPSLPSLLPGLGALPTMLVWGDEDLVCPRGAIDVYAAALPHPRVEVLPGVGHRPDLEAPGRFVEILSDFLGA